MSSIPQAAKHSKADANRNRIFDSSLKKTGEVQKSVLRFSNAAHVFPIIFAVRSKMTKNA